jgi:hypothetical protein
MNVGRARGSFFSPQDLPGVSPRSIPAVAVAEHLESFRKICVAISWDVSSRGSLKPFRLHTTTDSAVNKGPERPAIRHSTRQREFVHTHRLPAEEAAAVPTVIVETGQIKDRKELRDEIEKRPDRAIQLLGDLK